MALLEELTGTYFLHYGTITYCGSITYNCNIRTEPRRLCSEGTISLPTFFTLYYLKVNQLGNVGVSDEHLMQQTTYETLHLPQVTEQASLWLSVLHTPSGSLPQASLLRYPWHRAPNALQQALCSGLQLLLFGGWQTHLQENLDCCAVLKLNRNRWFDDRV